MAGTRVESKLADERKPQKKQLNFYDCIQPACRISRIFGLFPFSISFDSADQVQAKVGIFNAVWFICSIVINTVLSCIVLSSPNDESDSQVLLLFDWLFWIFGPLMLALSIALDMLNRNRLQKIVSNFMEFDQNVSNEEASSSSENFLIGFDSVSLNRLEFL